MYLSQVGMISCPLAQFQMSFTSLLQEAEMDSPFLLMYAKAVKLSSFNKKYSLYRNLLCRKGSLQLKEVYVAFIFDAIPSTSNFYHLICTSPAFQLCIRKNCKIKMWKLNGWKSIKNASYPPL